MKLETVDLRSAAKRFKGTGWRFGEMRDTLGLRKRYPCATGIFFFRREMLHKWIFFFCSGLRDFIPTDFLHLIGLYAGAKRFGNQPASDANSDNGDYFGDSLLN